MNTDGLKERLKKGKPSFGVGLLWPSPELVELCGFLGFDWLWLDVEHGPFDLGTLSHVVRAAELSGMDAIARISNDRNEEQVLKYLETGVAGIIMPHVRGKEDVEFAVQAVKYPPVGIRSSGGLRPAQWSVGSGPSYFDRTNDKTVVMALVEDEEGLENMDEILSVEGLDAVVIGFGDLSLTMGHPADKNHPEVLKVGTEAQEKILASDKALQVTAQNGAEASEWIKKGALMVRCSLHQKLIPTLKNWLEEAKS